MDAATELRTMLLERIRGTDNTAALDAIKALRAFDGAVILRAESLIRANLQGANLAGADMRETVLIWANLYDANLTRADMQGVVLFRANLRDANLIGADLRRAYLLKADFRNAYLHQVVFDEGTTLPDGHCWTPNVDVTRYTDPKHPHFWAVDDPALPAHSALPGWLRNDLIQ